MSKCEENDLLSRYKLPCEITVAIDTREQVPLLFPETVDIAHPERPGATVKVRVKTRRATLTAGDYLIQEFPRECVVERKWSQMELAKNLTDMKDSIRQAKALRRLAGSCRYPCLLMEATPAEMLEERVAAGQIQIPKPTVILYHLISSMIVRYQLHLLWIPWGRATPQRRRQLGTVVLSLMLGCALGRGPAGEWLFPTTSSEEDLACEAADEAASTGSKEKDYAAAGT